MNGVLVINFLSAAALILCAVLTVRHLRRRRGYRTSFVIIGIVIMIESFVVIGNLLEHGLGFFGMDRIEEYLEITLPLFYFLFVISYSLQDGQKTIAEQKDRLEKWNEALETEVGKKAAELKETYSELTDTKIALLNRNRAASFDQVIRKLSHLINTPLGICVTSASALLGSRSEDDEATLELLQASLGQITALTSEIRKVLDLQTEEERERFRIGQLVDEVAKGLMLEQAAEFSYFVYGGEASFFGYRENLKKVMRELMENSVIHNAGIDDLTIDVNVFMRGDDLVLRFGDNGRGIAEDFAGQVFDPFTTPSLSDSRLGLGLFMVRSIVQNVFHGDVSMDPAAKRGAGFIVTIPKSEPTEETERSIRLASGKIV